MYMHFMDVITRDLGALALQSLAQTFIAGPSSISDLPSSLPVEIDGAFPVTHALAIFSPANVRINVFPVHETILRVHCMTLLPFPVVDDIPEDHVPVVFLSLPHPESYVPISQYLYTHRQDVLFAALCPGVQAFGHSPFLSSTPQVRLTKDLVVSAAKALRATRPVIESMHYIHGLWHNMVALGIHDDGMWEVVLLAYSLYALAALAPSH
ncbi:hypothetical protein BDZ89DRAFT_533431 [Hymenopellis radicata]|nr:hypothetical protein BDZ89DRAFT_533431 [Hymenopellis radicata]